MLSWFTDNSIFPMVSGTILVVILLAMAFSAREKVLVYVALVIAALTAGTVLCEKLIVTDVEKVEQAVGEIADAVQANDRERVVSFISKKRQDTIDRVNAEMPQYDFSSCRVLGTNYSNLSPGPPKTIEHCFVVSFRVRVNGSPEQIPGHRKIILTFEEQPEAPGA